MTYYVVVSERDSDELGPARSIIWETYLDDATLENAQQRIRALGNRYGRLRIAEIEFAGFDQGAGE